MTEEKFIKCMCGSPEHQAIFGYDPDEEDFPELWIEIHLCHYENFFKRIWMAAKYIFGYHCKYGHWDCLLLDEAKGIEVRDFINWWLSGLKEA